MVVPVPVGVSNNSYVVQVGIVPTGAVEGTVVPAARVVFVMFLVILKTVGVWCVGDGVTVVTWGVFSPFRCWTFSVFD